MAHQTGTATDYLDLMNRLALFAELQGWTVLRNTYADATDQQLILKAPFDVCHVGVCAIEGTNVENYRTVEYTNWQLNAFLTYDETQHLHAQNGAIPQYPYGSTSTSAQTQMLPLDSNPFKYWFFVSETRVIVVARIRNKYVSCYLGLIDPITTPDEYPMPLLVGGSLCSHNTVSKRVFSIDTQLNGQETSTWSLMTSFVSNWMFARNQKYGEPKVMLPDNTWEGIYNRNNFNAYTYPLMTSEAKVFPTDAGTFQMGRNFDGSYPLIQTMIVSGTDGTLPEIGSWLGHPRGVFITAGHGNSPENIIHDQDMNQYIAFPNVDRTDSESWFAIKLD